MAKFERYREHFPQVKDGLIYLDSATSSLLPFVSINEMANCYKNYGAYIPAGANRFAEEVERLIRKARKTVSRFLGSRSENLAFTKGLAYNSSLILEGLNPKKGDRVLTSIAEQHSLLLPLLKLKKSKGITIDFIEKIDGSISSEDISNNIYPETRLVALSHASVLSGGLLNVEEVAKVVHDHNSLLYLDASQSVARVPLNFDDWSVDFLSCTSSLGFMAPAGLGMLLVKDEIKERLNPIIIGNHTANWVSKDDYSLVNYPLKFEPDELDIGLLVALTTSIELLEEMSLDRIIQNEEELGQIIQEEFNDCPKIELFDPEADHRVGIYSFCVEEINPHDLSFILNESANIIVRSGSLCALPLMNKLNKNGIVRASLSPFNNMEDVTSFLEAIELIINELT